MNLGLGRVAQRLLAVTTVLVVVATTGFWYTIYAHEPQQHPEPVRESGHLPEPALEPISRASQPEAKPQNLAVPPAVDDPKREKTEPSSITMRLTTGCLKMKECHNSTLLSSISENVLPGRDIFSHSI